MSSDEEDPSFGEELDMDRLLQLLEDQGSSSIDCTDNFLEDVNPDMNLTTLQSVQQQQNSDNLPDVIGETAIDHPLLSSSQTMQPIHRVSESNHLHDTIRQIGLDYLQFIHRVPESDHLHDTICQVGLDYLDQQIEIQDDLHGFPSPPVSETNKELLDSDQPRDAIGQIEPRYLHQRIVLDFNPIDQESGHSSQAPPMHEPPNTDTLGNFSTIVPPMDPLLDSFWDYIRSTHEMDHSQTSEVLEDSFWDYIGSTEMDHSQTSEVLESSFWDYIGSTHEMDHLQISEVLEDAQQENHLAEVELFNDLGNDSQIGGNPPASQSVADNLPSVVVAENTICAVCGDKISLQEVATLLPCLHEYHKECILPWLGIRNSCPICRYELPTDDPEYERSKRRRTDAEV